MTRQAGDIYFFDDAMHVSQSDLFEVFLEQIDWKPLSWSVSTANYRGYTARWEVLGNQLFLTGLFGGLWEPPAHLLAALPPSSDPPEAVRPGLRSLRLADLFPDEAPLVPASWVTTRLYVGLGAPLGRDRPGWATLHAVYRELRVVRGRVVGRRVLAGGERPPAPGWPLHEDLMMGLASGTVIAWPAGPARAGPPPDWRADPDPDLWWLSYEGAQREALAAPCGAVPTGAPGPAPAERRRRARARLRLPRAARVAASARRAADAAASRAEDREIKADAAARRAAPFALIQAYWAEEAAHEAAGAEGDFPSFRVWEAARRPAAGA